LPTPVAPAIKIVVLDDPAAERQLPQPRLLEAPRQRAVVAIQRFRVDQHC
jgi:hypothetical protein